jgi:hypothetical protein
MKNSERGEPVDGLDKKFEFSKILLRSILIVVSIVLIGAILGGIFEKSIDFSAILPWTVSIFAVVTPYIKNKQ